MSQAQAPKIALFFLLETKLSRVTFDSPERLSL